jgi:hypothetical protein
MSEALPERPLLLFGESAPVDREKLTSGRSGGRFHRPTAAEQGTRLTGKWSALQRELEQRTASVASGLSGTDPELVLVMEIIGDVPDFVRAVSMIEGFEYLAEIDESDVDGGDDFVDLDDADANFAGTLFLLASNQTALAEALELWGQYQANESASFPRGLARWKNVFKLLLDLRRWSASDRLRGTGALEDFAERRARGQDVVLTEIELWFRGDPARRAASQATVEGLVRLEGGEVITSAVIAPIAYHALLVSLPIASIDPILEGRPDDVALIRAEQISFVRPEAQAVVEMTPLEEAEPPFASGYREASDEAPLVAVLDGVPLVRHSLLDSRIVLDDPDDWQSEVPAADRQHGTAMASLVIHGDGGASGASLARRAYFRPVLLPDENPFSLRETVPHDELAIDLIHRSVVRMLTSDARSGGAVKLINLSVGDAGAQLATTLSPWARLLDWLAYEYRVIFVVSAGNHVRPLALEKSINDLNGLTAVEVRAETLAAMVDDAPSRRIFSPSEAVNCLCVGAAHDDACGTWVEGNRRDLLPSSGSGVEALPSPITAAGMGYRRSIKPDLLGPGGRVLFRPPMTGHSSSPSVFEPAGSSLPPGLKVATPTTAPGGLDGSRYIQGTSGAAAIVSHHGGLLLEELADLTDSAGTRIPPEYWAVMTKTLLVHSSALPEAAREVRRAFGDMSPDRLKDAVSRFYGYGVLDDSRLLRCSETRATALGWGELKNARAELFEFPLPPSLSGRSTPRRVIITVGYLAPLRVRDRRHRAAMLFIKPDKDILRVSRSDADWRTVRRGSVQHEILGGASAAAFVDGDSLAVQVNCRSLVGTLADGVPFGLAVTLEVPEESNLAIYSQVEARLRIRARSRVRGT